MTTEPYRSRIVGHGEADPATLAPNPRNWRAHPEPQRAVLAGVLGEVGWVQDVIVNQRTGYLVDGHLRVEEAIRAGSPTVPVVYVDLDEAEEALVLATLDTSAAMATANAERLDALLRDVHSSDSAISQMLAGVAAKARLTWGQPEPVADPGAQVDRAEELRAKWGVERGQLWDVGAHRLLCGDSTDAGDVSRLMGGERAALMATDPPYLVDYSGGNHPATKANKGAKTKDKHWDDYKEGDGPEFFAAFIRVALAEALTDNPAIYQWYAIWRHSLVEQAWKMNGLLWHQTILWVKPGGVLTHSHYLWRHEPCFYGWVEGKGIDSRPPASETTVWELGRAGDSDNLHPTQKPRELFARPMRWHIPAGGLAYEPFSGSGTALVAAEQEGRRCYAMEIEPKYVAVTLERMAGMGLEPRLLADA